MAGRERTRAFPVKPILASAAAGSENQDRGFVTAEGGRLVLCVADGAGGRGGAAEAAHMAVEWVRHHAARLHSAESCVALITALDTAMARDLVAGETTCALATVTPHAVYGASVGDSAIWLMPQTGPPENLTVGQQRRPFVGCGNARPVAFHREAPSGTLLLATDGLLKYTSTECILRVCREHPAADAAQLLIGLVRYASGALPDDVTVILASL